MLATNLLDKNLKKRVKKQKVKTLMGKIFSFATVCFILICLFLVGNNFYFNSEFKKIEKNTNNALLENNELFNDIKKINKDLAKIANYQEGRIDWAQKLLALSEVTPDNIMIRQLDIAKDNKTFKIFGSAKDRGSFLIFKEDLENHNFFPEVISPLSNITSREDLSFTLSGRIQ